MSFPEKHPWMTFFLGLSALGAVGTAAKAIWAPSSLTPVLPPVPQAVPVPGSTPAVAAAAGTGL